MKKISSRQNPWFKRLREAIEEHRDEIVIEGPKAVSDAIAAGWKPIAVVTTDETLPLGTHFFSAELFRSLAETRATQGVLGLFARPRPPVDFDSVKVIVALDGVQDPGNVGTIVRLAAAFDVAGVVLLPGCADAYSPKAIRASAGAILVVPVVELPALSDGRPLFYADAAGAPLALPSRATLVFGSEGTGVSVAIRSVARAVAVETSGNVESLNVAASAAILLWQAFRSRSR